MRDTHKDFIARLRHSLVDIMPDYSNIKELKLLNVSTQSDLNLVNEALGKEWILVSWQGNTFLLGKVRDNSMKIESKKTESAPKKPPAIGDSAKSLYVEGLNVEALTSELTGLDWKPNTNQARYPGDHAWIKEYETDKLLVSQDLLDFIKMQPEGKLKYFGFTYTIAQNERTLDRVKNK